MAQLPSPPPTAPFSPLRRLWYKWKALRLPWRRQFLMGFDLLGNTYWEFSSSRSSSPTTTTSRALSPALNPTRRIVKYPRGFSFRDKVSIPPAWHQWLRYMRAEPLTLAEQQAEVARQARLRTLAVQADERWRALPAKAVGGSVGVGEIELGREGKGAKGALLKERGVESPLRTDAAEVGVGERARKDVEGRLNVWQPVRRGLGENWQPEAWDPGSCATKRQ